MPAAKKAVSKKSQKTTKANSKKRPVPTKSFQACPNDSAFLTFSLTRQTIYWLVLALVVFVLGLWIIKLQNDISYIYDQIETTTATGEQVEAEIQAKKQADKK